MPEREEPTAEVGSEGGGAGDVEIVSDDRQARGSETTATIDRVERREHGVAHDETGVGRRSPTVPTSPDANAAD